MTVLDDQREWDELIAQIPLDTPVGDAARALADLLHDAVQAQRPWAKERLRSAMLAGLSKTWTAHTKKQRADIPTKTGTVKAIGGAKRRDAAGNLVHLQLPFDLMPFEELAQHRDMEATAGRSISENVRVQDRLLALREKVPTAKNAAEACEQLGLDPADVMAGAA